MGSQTQLIPVVDLKGESIIPGSASWVAACSGIRHALEVHGFFVAEYDGIPLQLHQDILSDAEQLFQLPYNTKIKNKSDIPGFGYDGKYPTIPLFEGLGIDRATDLDNCNNFCNLMWPDSGNNRFSENAHKFAELTAELERTLVRMLFESYGLEKEQCDAHVGTATYLLRILKYTKPSNDEAEVGLKSHTDKSFITILHQDDVRGLELQMDDGNWVWFEPSPTSFVVLAGDACMAWSNERVKSGYHRVTMKRNLQESTVRYSLALFSFQSKLIETPKKLVDKCHPLQYKPFDHLGLLMFYYKAHVRIKATHTMIRAYCGTSVI